MGHNSSHIFFDVGGERVQVPGYFAAEGCEAVLNFGRLGGVDGALHEAVFFESAECLCEHFFADAAYEIGEFTEAIAAIAQDDQNERSPAGGDVVEDTASGAVGSK